MKVAVTGIVIVVVAISVDKRVTSARCIPARAEALIPAYDGVTVTVTVYGAGQEADAADDPDPEAALATCASLPWLCTPSANPLAPVEPAIDWVIPGVAAAELKEVLNALAGESELEFVSEDSRDLVMKMVEVMVERVV